MEVVVDGLVWMKTGDLTSRNLENIRRELTIVPRKTTDIDGAEDPDPIFMFRDDDDRGMIGVPRGYYLARKSSEHDEIVNVSYGKKMRDLKTRFSATGPYVEQETAISALMSELEGKRWGGVLLRGAPGFGKTILAIEFARRVGRKTLILVHKEFLLRQWRERLEWQLPGVRIGLIRQNKCEYDQIEATGQEPDFVIGMLQSLSRGMDGKKYPDAMWRSFGLVISDETHRVGAGSWASIIPSFTSAYRLGLTATPRRKDGAEDVFFMNISKVTYSAKSKMMMPKLRRVITPTKLKPIVRGNYRVSTDNLNSAQVINQIAADEFRSRQIVDDIVKGVAAGRKILVVSERLEHLRKMSRDLISALFDMKLPFDPRVDYYTGQWFTSERWEKSGKGHKRGDFKMKTRTEAELKVAERANVIFCTSQMMSEGLDVTASDVLVMATPISDIVQLVGRVQRWCFPEEGKCERLCAWRAGKCKGKPDPIVVDVIDENIPQLKRKWIRRQSFYKKNGAMK